MEDELRRDFYLIFLMGISTRTLLMFSSQLNGWRKSLLHVCRAYGEFKEAAEEWRERDFSAEKIEYMFLVEVCLRMRLAMIVKDAPLLASIG